MSTPAGMTSARAGARGQLRALLALRWSMARHPLVRGGLLLLLVGVIGAVVGLSVSGPAAPREAADQVGLMLPTALLAFAVMCVVAPLTAGGGFELVPAEHLVAFPVRPRTTFAASVVLTPLNVAWLLQVLALVAVVAWTFGPAGVPWAAYVVLACYAAAVTVAGHAVAWAVTGIRRTRTGRWATWVAVAGYVALGAGVVLAGRVTELLDRAPTVSVVTAMSSGQHGRWVDWGVRVAVLAAAATALWLGGVRACTAALTRPSDGGSASADRPVTRRTEGGSLASDLIRVDRSSVWRSPPLRRGLLVLVLLPGVVALAAGMPWASIVLLPPLVASGAALLFGVNAFCLDGSGALFLASAPVDPRLLLRSKTRVVAEVVTASVVMAVVAAAVRAGVPRPVDLLAAAGSALACSALVVGMCLHLSVTRPHRADMRDARDTPAPPGTMALYSVRLAAATTPVGLVFSLTTFDDGLLLPLLATAVVLTVAAWSLRRTRRAWADPTVRARVVATVAAG